MTEGTLLRRFNISHSTADWRDEMDLQARIGVSLMRNGGHEVYFHHAKAARLVGGRQFSVHGGSCRVDLLVRTRADWDRWHAKAHEEMPAVGIEVKLAKDLKWLKEGVEQVRGYVAESFTARYEVDGKTLPRPTHFLLATDDSWHTGHLYRWWDVNKFAPLREVVQFASEMKCTEDEARYFLMERAWRGVTETWDQVLLGMGASILKGPDGHFMTNRFGALRKYTLDDRGAYLGTPAPTLTDLLGGGR